MDAKILDEKTVYLYELSNERFKESQVILRIYDNNKAVITKKDKKAIVAASIEGKIFKQDYIWLEKRNKLKAADIFKYKIQQELDKEYEALDKLKSKNNILGKYYESRR